LVCERNVWVNGLGLLHRLFCGFAFAACGCRLLTRSNLAASCRCQFLFGFAPKLSRLLAAGRKPTTRRSDYGNEQPDGQGAPRDDDYPYPQRHERLTVMPGVQLRAL
jgi:hypothetical protein